MSLIASAGSASPRVLPPTGSHVARCVQIIDLGTQDDVSPTYGARIVHKARVTWELPLEKRVFDETKGEQPFFVSKKYTVSLTDKSNLTKDLQSWRGKSFTEEELKGFELKNILGKVCMVSIIHKVGKQSGKTNEEITAVSQIPKGLTVPPAISPLIYYEVEQGRDAVYDQLPQFLKDDIAKCHEWRNKPAAPEVVEEGDEEDNIDLDSDSIPF